MLWFAAEETVTSLTETQPVALEVQADLAALKPNVILQTIQGWIPGMVSLAYRLFIAALIVLIGMRIASMFRSFLRRSFEKMEMDLSLSKFLLSLANAVIYVLIAFMALERIGVPSASIIALLGSATLAIGLSLQGSLSNFAGGILILVMRPFAVGDYIVAQGMEGTVRNIGLVYTTLKTGDNKEITIPNGGLANTVITNVTAVDKRRVDISVGIGYQSDLKQAKEILNRIFQENERILQEEGISVFVDTLADSAVMLGARGWAATGDYWSAKCEITEAVKIAFDAAGIEIPYNQLDVKIKS
ncbi:MAG: mechanosensitive ion channel family protein [Lachnospiraceae bacterium]